MTVERFQYATGEAQADTLRAILQAAGTCAYEYDVASGALRWPLAGDEAFGHGTDRLDRLERWLDLVHPEDRLLAHAAMAEPAPGPSSGAAAPCFRLRDPSGSDRWIEVRGRRLAHGPGPVCVGLLADVTARRESERQLELAARVLETLRHAVAVADVAGTVQWHNAAFAALVGLPGTRLVGRTLAEYCAAPAARRIEQQQEIRDAVMRRGSWQGRIDMRRADGRVAVTEAGVDLAPGPAGDLWVHVRHDVTERVELEEVAVAAARAEQQRLGLELHDQLGQELAGTSMLVRTLRNALVAGQAPDAGLLRDVEHLLQNSVARCRDLAQGVSPFVIDDGGLGAALEDLASRTRRGSGLAIRLGVCPRAARLDGNIGYHLFRVTQLALATLLCRDAVTAVDLQVWREDDDRVALALVADGRCEPGQGADMRMLTHRLALLGGSWETLEASHGRSGLIAMVPLPAAGEGTLTRPALLRRA